MVHHHQSELKHHHLKSNWKAWVLGTLLVFAISVLTQVVRFNQMEAFFYDYRTRISASHKTSEHSILLVIDKESVKRLGGEPRAEHYIQLLSQGREFSGLALFIDPNEIVGTESELGNLASLFEDNENLSFVIDNLPRISQGLDQLVHPTFASVPLFFGPITSDRAQFARDGVTRRMILTFNGEPSFHFTMAEKLAGNRDFLARSFDYKESVQSYVRFGKAGSFQRISFVDVLEKPEARDQLSNRLVLVGRETEELAKDYALTPVSNDLAAMSRLEVQAHALESLIRNQAPYQLSGSTNFFITFFLSLLTLYLVMQVRPTAGIVLFFVSSVGFLIGSFALFWIFSVWVNISQPMVAMLTCYYFFIPYRLIKEHKRSWEYYKKNQLLMQVEELKGNFLKMMSHDLKTPLARIQGMCETIERGGAPLAAQQIKALQGIKQSASDLTEFVSNILSLGRIESREMKLHLASKDLNALLNSVVSSCRPLANEKNIEIICDFEPLFSVKVDEDLMRQVFTNLLENAIKYSSENTRIMISTDEMEDYVLVEVADQGIGISKADQASIFEKFYRSKKVLNHGSPGTGLGLYLVKYFIELHGGSIQIDSELGAGSTFSIRIPKELDVVDGVAMKSAGPKARREYELEL